MLFSFELTSNFEVGSIVPDTALKGIGPVMVCLIGCSLQMAKIHPDLIVLLRNSVPWPDQYPKWECSPGCSCDFFPDNHIVFLKVSIFLVILISCSSASHCYSFY